MRRLIHAIQRLFCKHIWIEHKRSTVKVYETWDYYDPMPSLPTYRKVTIELKCKTCGDIKIVQYKE